MSYTLVLWFRRFRREPAVVTLLVISLALPLAGTMVALSLNSAVAWRSLPFRDPDQLLQLEVLGANAEPRWLSLAELRMLTESLRHPFSDICGYTAADFIALSEPPLRTQPLLATMVSPQFFDVFGIRPALGDLPDAESYTSGERVVMLSHELWTRRYRGATDIVGRRIRLAGPEYLTGADGTYRIVGVLPRELWLFWKQADIVLPLRTESALAIDPNRHIVEHVVGRLANDAGLAAARGMADTMRASIAAAGARDPVLTVGVSSLHAAHFRNMQPQLLTILGSAIVVLTLALINVAIASTARALSRRQETAIQMAIGGGAWRLFRDGILEHAITAGIAGFAGGSLGIWLTPIVASQVPGQWLAKLPGEGNAVRVDLVSGLVFLGVLAAVTIITSVIAQTVVRQAQPGSLLSSALSHEPRGSRRLRSMLVTAEIALCACAIGVGGIAYLQLAALQQVDIGVESHRTFAIWLNLSPSKYTTDAARSDYYDAILERARGVAGLGSVGGVDLPFHFGWQRARVRPESMPSFAEVNALDRSATEGYLEASGIRLLEGRWFDGRDRRGSPPTIVVSQSLAGAVWPDGDALGQPLSMTSEAESSRSSAIVVGVVSDTRQAPHLPADRTLYRAVPQAPPPWLYLVARSRTQMPDIASELMDAIWSLDPDLAIDGPWSVRHWIDGRSAHLRFIVLLTSLLAVIGVILCGAGLYGLTSYWVSASARDLGVRRAVGAADAHIAAWFGKQWMAVVVPGLAIGILLQVAVFRLLVAGIEGFHEPTWPQVAAACAAVASCAMCGAAAPLRRALRADAASLMRP